MLRSPFLLVPGVVVIAAIFAVALTRGSDGKHRNEPRSGAHGETSSAAQKLVPFAEFRNVPLDTPRTTIERQFGKPVRSAPAGALDPGTTCLFYPAPADAAPATEYQLCFLEGKLHSKFAG